VKSKKSRDKIKKHKINPLRQSYSEEKKKKDDDNKEK